MNRTGLQECCSRALMSHLSFFRSLQPHKLMRAVRSRGLRGTVMHGLRRAGTVMERPLVGPSLLRINPMQFVCNHTCPMCWLQHLDPADLKAQKQTDRERGMKFEHYRRLFDSFPLGLEEVNVVGGGEPLVHPQAVEIMEEVKRHGWRGSLITNGTLLKEAAAQRLVDARWDDVRVSVHANDPETYRRIQGVDRFETMKSNLITLNRLRRSIPGKPATRLSVFHVVQRENLHCIPSLFQLAEEVGADFIEFDKIIPHDPDMMLTFDESKRLREELESCARDSRIPCNSAQILGELQSEEHCLTHNKPFIPAKRCSVGFDQAYITSLGDVLPCCFSNEVLGNVLETPFHELWFGEKYQKFRVRLINGKFARYCITSRCTLPGVLHH